MRAGRAGRGQQVTEDGVRDEVECVSGDVPQDHGPGPPVESQYALGLQDVADAVDRASVESLVGNVNGAKRDVGAVGHITSQLEVPWKKEKIFLH